MIDIYQLYQSFQSMANTHQGGFFRPVRDFVPALETVSQEVYNRLTQKLEKTATVTDMLLPFFERINVPVKKANGFEYAPFPPNYSRFSAAKILYMTEEEQEIVVVDGACKALKDGRVCPADDLADFFPVVVSYEERDIKDVPDSRFGAATRHATLKPTMQNPIGTRVREGYKIAPAGVGSVLLSYYRNPLPPVMDYTLQVIGPDEIIQYKQASSTQLEWDQQMKPVFLYKLMLHFGLATSDEQKMAVSKISEDLL